MISFIRKVQNKQIIYRESSLVVYRAKIKWGKGKVPAKGIWGFLGG